MTKKRSQSVEKMPPRKLRTDAARNRERLLEAAKEAFTIAGAEASLEDIARRAEVGAGTLYRHFPTRDALIEAVYHSEVEKLAAAAQNYVEEMAPVEALRAWMLLFVDYIAAKHIIAPALNSVGGGASRLYEGSRGQVLGAIDGLLKRAVKRGEIRREVEAQDLIGALVGLAHFAPGAEWKRSAQRLVELLIAGARVR
ncbi:TetR/AcrR family transcriptional regulator [Occallatibacter riparius]|uniref:TetR/AcrR family transcriptional regulator n=1 Tax=Occallatibacter riparius TaxID=1002689 RepID=A0A9J7BSW5_9BACT|nr:TetR/AcrR family transcriptional regulator [Occallatibacter riparius]UWZ84109.1 TetR/AcrR family transcriptional regulator [Occallatibacter riparius]